MLKMNLNIIKPKTIYAEGEVIVRAYWFKHEHKDYTGYSLGLNGTQFYDPKTGDPVDEETAKAYIDRLMEAYLACETADKERPFVGLRFAHQTDEAKKLFDNKKGKGWIAFDGSAINFKVDKVKFPKSGENEKKVVAYLDCDLLVG